MPSSDALITLLQQPGAEPVPVPGRPNKVYVWSKTKGEIVITTPARAQSWRARGDAARAAAKILSSVGRTSDSSAAIQPRRLAVAPSQPSLAQLALENPMSHDDEYENEFQGQYQPFSPQPYDPFAAEIGQFGARKFQPIGRRNPPKKKAKAPAKRRAAAAPKKTRKTTAKAAQWQATFGKITRRAQQIQSARNCKYKSAFDQARSEIMGPMARANGLALTNGKAEAKAAMSLFHSGRASSLKEAWRMVKGGARSNPRAADNFFGPSVPPRRTNYDAVIGQFGAGHPQPIGRRNPKGGVTIARFPGDCSVCGAAFKPMQDEIADSGRRGPKGGKLMAHTRCI